MKFITLEGVDGAGKSSHIEFIAETARTKGGHVVVTREPGGTELAERLRETILTAPMAPILETLLMFAARDLHLQSVIRPALARGEWVVCDRFTDATRAYQGSGRGVDPQLIESLAAAVHGGLAPDCTLLLDVPVSVGLARARGRAAGDTDRFEAETQAFFEKVRAGYLELARCAPERFHVIDAGAPLAAVEARVEGILEDLA